MKFFYGAGLVCHFLHVPRVEGCGPFLVLIDFVDQVDPEVLVCVLDSEVVLAGAREQRASRVGHRWAKRRERAWTTRERREVLLQGEDIFFQIRRAFGAPVAEHQFCSTVSDS